MAVIRQHKASETQHLASVVKFHLHFESKNCANQRGRGKNTCIMIKLLCRRYRMWWKING